jgi:hypothetical protein
MSMLGKPRDIVSNRGHGKQNRDCFQSVICSVGNKRLKYVYRVRRQILAPYFSIATSNICYLRF